MSAFDGRLLVSGVAIVCAFLALVGCDASAQRVAAGALDKAADAAVEYVQEGDQTNPPSGGY